MNKVLLVVALLLLATPLYAADVTITATVGSASGDLCPVTIGWAGAAEANSIRGFALVLTVDSGTNLTNIRDFNRGESTRAGGGYGIFPGKFRDNVNPIFADACMALPAYNPIAPSGDMNGSGGDGLPRMVVELGTLFTEPCSPGTSGTLFTIDVNKAAVPSITSCILNVQVDATRGGVVKKDATGATVTLPGTAGAVTVAFGPPTCTVPTVVGSDRASAIAAITGAGFTVGTESNVPGTGQAMRTVTAQNPAGGASAPCGSAVAFSAVSWPIKPTAPASLQANWITCNRPKSWAYPRQCRGDADGLKAGLFWVSQNDLNKLKLSFNKTVAQLNPLNDGYAPDFDHAKAGLFWVSQNDLNILKRYFNKAEASVPVCGSVVNPSTDPNYWFYCLPTGATCPAGQYCAPAGVCPNSL